MFESCKIYSFRDVSIDYSKIKTIKIGFIENKARIVNPQLSPMLTDKLQQKITNQTKLIRTNNDDAHLQLSGYISDYSVTTTGVSAQQAATNRLTITLQLNLKNTVENTDKDFTVSRSFDFSANLSLDQAQISLQDEILRNLTDEIFNHIFSNW
ncbi:MAG: LPS assembly lipoprotein LptE [Chitinophagales bacterium]|nr:LPS assembly lipoprotein LptE [Chitinophagales bacterium]